VILQPNTRKLSASPILKNCYCRSHVTRHCHSRSHATQTKSLQCLRLAMNGGGVQQVYILIFAMCRLCKRFREIACTICTSQKSVCKLAEPHRCLRWVKNTWLSLSGLRGKPNGHSYPFEIQHCCFSNRGCKQVMTVTSSYPLVITIPCALRTRGRLSYKVVELTRTVRRFMLALRTSRNHQNPPTGQIRDLKLYCQYGNTDGCSRHPGHWQ